MEILDIIQGIFPLPRHDAQNLANICEQIVVPKNATIIQTEQICKYIYFLKEGCCRIYYHREEMEIVLDFCFQGDVILSLNSYIHQKPGYEKVDCLEKSVLFRIPSSSLQQLYQTSLPISNWGRKLAELETLKIEDRLLQTLFKTAAEKYRDLLQKEPALLQKVKLGHIASYLGVSQVTLSRIRAEIK
jgi:CRP-like cAMP-binding protein